MPAFKIYLLIAISAFLIPPNLYAANTVKTTGAIKEYRDQITDERDAIIADGSKLREAKKAGDKVKIEETTRDIEKRKTAIRELYNKMGNSGANKPIERENKKKK